MHNKEKLNLNELKIKTDSGSIDLEDHSYKMKDAQFDCVEVILRDLESNLIKKIRKYKDGLIFGSVAWLTSFNILDELAKCDNVQIVVQKEYFLRPDLNTANKKDWNNNLREKYNKLKFRFERFFLNFPIGRLSFAGDPTVDPIRCVGNHNRDKKIAFPRAHNKFLVFCEILKEPTEDLSDEFEDLSTPDEEFYKPISVWTGSFNLTLNAANSFENAIYLEDKTGTNPVINAFLKEHHQIFALSESLDWNTDWVVPEFRIGT